ncbi:MAG: zf-HC2 domain-containing protein [Desulfobacterales bacterium]|jgi:anti-sigma factor RsiW|nr:zf-HC2 domain-containing protein [Desulfobacterales bacterium]
MACDASSHPHCLELFEKLSEYIDDELAPAERREIEAHVAGCVACLACLQTLRRTVALCRTGADHPVPEEFSRRLRSALAAPPRGPA